jgi:hypothetical protein
VRGSHLDVRRSLLSLTLVLAGLLLAACGVSFSDSPPESELFTDLDIVGETVVLEPMTAVLQYEQVYPVPVKVKCYLVRPHRARWLVKRETIEANPDDSPEPEPVPGTLTFHFLVSKPGKHFIDCLTPKDTSNFISVDFDVKEADESGGG